MAKKKFTNEEWAAIKNNGAFCPAPFFSYHINAGDKLSACCIQNANNRSLLPDITPGTSLKEVYNHLSFVELRRDLVAGVKNSQCKRCWTNEEIGTRSMRQLDMLQWMNRWPGAEDYIRSSINDDYTIDEPKIYYIDIRFDNTCNLRCRICDSYFSTSLYPEEKEYLSLHAEKHDGRASRLLSQFRSTRLTVNELKENLRTVRRIYFAGGEPLITPQHYEILDYLIEIGHTDVELFYHTNFSKLTHSKFDVVDYWKKFKTVIVGASLDGNYQRGEYIRKNLVWSKAIANRQRMIAEVPHVVFRPCPTVSIMSAYNLIDFHREWVEKRYIGPFDFSPNLLLNPPVYNIKNLPGNHKETLRKLYKEHIEWVKSLAKFNNRRRWYFEEFNSTLDPKLCIDGFVDALNLLDQPADSDWSTWWSKNQWLDAKRGENFYQVFPEYQDLKNIIVDYGHNLQQPD